MRVPGPTGLEAGLCAREREVGVEERSSSRYLDVYRFEAMLGAGSVAASIEGAWNDVGQSGVDLLGVLVEADDIEERPAVGRLDCLPATLSFERRISIASAPSSSSSSSIALIVDLSNFAGVSVRPIAALLVEAEVEEGVPLAPFARGRKTTFEAPTSSSSSNPSADAVRRGIDGPDPFWPATLVIDSVADASFDELPDGPTPTSSSSYVELIREAELLGLLLLTKLILST